MTEPVFSGVCFTGQPQTDREEVLCPVCKDYQNLLGLRTSAWYDPYIDNTYKVELTGKGQEQPRGLYVHYRCLSEQRKDELREKGYRFK